MNPDTIHTNNFAVIGHPVSHSLSPVLHSYILEKAGISGSYSAIDCQENQLSKIEGNLRDGSLQGVNVTIPYKKAIIPFLDEINPKAQEIGAVNCVVPKSGKLWGFNTDWFGFSKLLANNSLSPMGRIFVLIGAGGAARAVLYTLLREGAGAVYLINRSAERAQELINSFQHLQGCAIMRTIDWFDIDSYLSESAVIINTTPVGLPQTGSALPMPVEFIKAHHSYVDIIYHPWQTAFLKIADEHGAFTVNGIDMFIYQGLASLELWTGKDLTKDINIDDLRDYLQRHMKDL